MSSMEAATTATATEAPAEPVEGDEPSSTQSTRSDETQTPENDASENGGERDEQGRYLSREAASYRRRLRETESERDGLRERLEGYERADVERVAGDAGLQVASDVWTFGATLDTLRDEDGAIDHDAVHDLVKEIVKDRAGLQATPVGDIGIGKGAAAAGTARAPEVGLSALLKPGQR
jgi:hypothetical protein